MKNIHSDLLPDKALIACWEILDRLEVGDRIRVADFAPQKPDLFVECAKKYYDSFGSILFSDDYKEIKKILNFVEVENLFG
jgi:hypothetical protein